MPIRPRRIVPHVLLMPARQIGNPVKTLIQMVINNPARSAMRLRVQVVTCSYSTLFLRGVPESLQKPGCCNLVPLVTDTCGQKRENGALLNNEVANAPFMVGGTA
jgi:hypothetical protein